MKKIISLLLLIVTVYYNAQSINDKAQPLFIVDNVVVDRFFITDLDPDKIESLQVYKSPTSEFPELNDLAKNGIINIKLKQKVDLPKLSIKETKGELNLPPETQVYLNNVLIVNENIIISQDVLKRARIIQPDQTNGLTMTSLYLATSEAYYSK